MARNRNTDFFSFLRSQGLRKRVAKALSDLESGGHDARGNAEKVGRRVIADLRSAADQIEKRLNLGGSSRSSGRRRSAKKGAATRKRAATKRSAAAKKGAKTRARKSAPRKTTARKSTARKSTARKSARKRS